eukprot:TRINITY_DN89749_c0_g1_i1.p1 TRINITY_DN89749_c0_g1~~TRINITY_DN89749_c0_g1_i1.p1  ORF type:complete len:467 (-),score=67.08 TRINITY_DN89749_c0_g1_i1:112-1443(-)
MRQAMAVSAGCCRLRLTSALSNIARPAPTAAPLIARLPGNSQARFQTTHVVDHSPFGKLSVGELKRLLASRGVDYRDCFDKRELVERLESSEARLGHVTPAPAQLTEAERSRVELFQRCSGSVAFIQTSVQARDPYGLSLNMEQIPRGAGSGFVWDKDGHVITNFHVIQKAQAAKVTIGKSTEAHGAKLVGAEPEYDIAVLKVAAPESALQPVVIGSSAQLQVGQSVLAIGNPFGLDQTLTTGVVSALNREVQGVAGNKIQGCIQTDAAINPGNSGGPLLDSSGRLVGVNTAIYSPSGASAGIGFAIPVDTVRRVVNQIIRFGRARRAFLGVNLASDQYLQQIARQLGGDAVRIRGALVMSVVEGGPAAIAGIRPCTQTADGLRLGDLILKVNGVPVEEVEDVMMAIDGLDVGRTIVVTLRRGVTGPEEVVSLELRERPRQVL